MTHEMTESQHIVDQYQRRVSTRPVLRNERQPKSNIWFFDSPKNNCRSIIEGDLPFLYAVLLEGDVSVASYQVSPEPFIVQAGGASTLVAVGARVQLINRTSQWWDFRRLEGLSAAKRKAALKNEGKSALAQSVGVEYHIKTDIDFRGQETAFDNWLLLCAAITRCRGHLLVRERQHLSRYLTQHETMTLSTLLDIQDIDAAYMNAVVALSLQQGIVSTNLTTQLYGPHSILRRGNQ
ncbi:hypothetical protein [Rugamonas aquatica]|uniref:Uncharacterized protein n=1 Tax=Rugamonas aquatica TaxID=2743357 RepID=A0A6A7MW28_9BURK|nr:hypothetical protein [Rugamonas aquatica]MQA37050.1 hypothetical protein [Rugamonas aquatica]